MSRTLLMLVLFVAGGLAACSSTPDIPDEQKTYTYKSTKKKKTTQPDPKVTKTEKKNEAPATLMKAKGPVAVVNGKSISAELFNSKVQEISKGGKVQAALVNRLKERLVKGMVHKELLDQAVAGAKIDVTEADIDNKIKEIRADHARIQKLSNGQAGDFDMMLKRMGIQPDNIRTSIKQAIVVERLVKTSGYKEVEEAEVKKFYDANAQKFVQVEAVRARHILIKVSKDGDKAAWDKAKATIAVIRKDIIDNKKDFAEVAKVKSQGPSSKRGGDLGFFQKGQMVPEFEKSAFSMKDGEISQPIKTRFGWHLVKRVAYQKAGPIPFDKIKEILKSQLSNRKFQKALLAYIGKLHESGKVEYKLDNIS